MEARHVEALSTCNIISQCTATTLPSTSLQSLLRIQDGASVSALWSAEREKVKGRRMVKKLENEDTYQTQHNVRYIASAIDLSCIAAGSHQPLLAAADDGSSETVRGVKSNFSVYAVVPDYLVSGKNKVRAYIRNED